jgi:hypothetical protein
VNQALCVFTLRTYFFLPGFLCAELFFLVGLFFLGSAVFFDIQLNLRLVNYLLKAAGISTRSLRLCFERRQLYSLTISNKDMLIRINTILDQGEPLFKETDENKKVSYQFWQPDNHPELCYQLDFMWQKLEYIHNNPVKAGLVHKAEEYVYSSAADYVFGKQVGKVKVALLNPVQTTYS